MEHELFNMAMKESQKLTIEYLEIKFGDYRGTSIEVKDGELKKAVPGKEKGMGIRVLVDKAWGMCSTNDIKKHNLMKILNTAYKIAKVSSKKLKHPIDIAPITPHKTEEIWKVKVNPLDISIEEKYQMLLDLEKTGKTDICL